MNVKQTITLNLPYDLSDSDWEKVSIVYKQMDGWIDNHDGPYWFGTEEDDQYIWASVEPSGLLLSGKIDEMIWIGWITVLCAKLTLALGREIHNAES
ncbi:MAG: hypothetical protein WBA93_20755 [Microcoleaceae cyanobacterium]